MSEHNREILATLDDVEMMLRRMIVHLSAGDEVAAARVFATSGDSVDRLRGVLVDLRDDHPLREQLGELESRMKLRLACAECGRVDDGGRGWAMRLDIDDELVAFCPQCNAAEFGDA